MHKLVLAESFRYSEDIDLVQTDAEAIGGILDAVRGVLDPWLGKPVRKAGPGNTTLIYRFESEIQPVRPLRLKIEINTREHFVLNELQLRALKVNNPQLCEGRGVMHPGPYNWAVDRCFRASSVWERN